MWVGTQINISQWFVSNQLMLEGRGKKFFLELLASKQEIL